VQLFCSWPYIWLRVPQFAIRLNFWTAIVSNESKPVLNSYKEQLHAAVRNCSQIGFSRTIIQNCLTSGVANTSIAIDQSIAETQVIDHAWFCVELTRYLNITFFIQYFRKLHKNEQRCILLLIVLVTLLPTGRSRVIKKFSSRSQSKTSWPPLSYIRVVAEFSLWITIEVVENGVWCRYLTDTFEVYRE